MYLRRNNLFPQHSPNPEQRNIRTLISAHNPINTLSKPRRPYLRTIRVALYVLQRLFVKAEIVAELVEYG